MSRSHDTQYTSLMSRCLRTGDWKPNRTGIKTIGYIGDMCKYDMADGFPALTTKKLAFKSVVAEMLGFLRGYDNAAEFRELGCNVWNANANENEQWLANGNRRGEDDLGRIYGVQARDWGGGTGGKQAPGIDQLKTVVDKLNNGVDDRRLIVSHWNPSDMDQMALPPCHLLYQFGLQGGRLHLTMYQRSCDLPLGVPFNIAGYAWLLCTIAHITGHVPGVLTHFMHDIHIYENQIEQAREQITRVPYDSPALHIDRDIMSLEDLETWVIPENFKLVNYNHRPHIKYPFAV